jgi:AcrR family transcriptional regulator
MESDRVGPILEAAYACFTRHGVRRTTMDDIAQEAGMSRGAVYQYVRNKEDAFRRLAERMLGEALAGARVAAEAPTELAERLAAMLETKLQLVLRVWRDSPAHAAELLGDDARLSADMIEAYDDEMRSLLAGAVRAVVPDADAGEIAEVLLALARGIEADLSDPDVPIRRLRYAVALIVSGLEKP